MSSVASSASAFLLSPSSVQGMTLNCIHIFIVTGSFLYCCVMRPASQRFFIHSCIYILILIISYLATFHGTNSLSVLMCRKAVNQFKQSRQATSTPRQDVWWQLVLCTCTFCAAWKLVLNVVSFCFVCTASLQFAVRSRTMAVFRLCSCVFRLSETDLDLLSIMSWNISKQNELMILHFMHWHFHKVIWSAVHLLVWHRRWWNSLIFINISMSDVCQCTYLHLNYVTWTNKVIINYRLHVVNN